MLETVKDYISCIPNKSFNQYFVEYMIAVQDSNIEEEISYLLSHNTLDVLSMGRVIEKTYKGLREDAKL